MAAYVYERLVMIGPWSGPRFLAGRATVFNANGYDPLLEGLGSEIVRSSVPGTRSSAQVTILNVTFSGKLVSQHAIDDPIEGKVVTIYERPISPADPARTLFVGRVRKKTMTQELVTLECVDESVQLSPKLGRVIDTATWPRARKEDVGKELPIPVGEVEDMEGHVTEWNPSASLADDLNSSATEFDLSDLPAEFPVSGTVRIDDELIAYTLADPGNPALSVPPSLQGLSRGQGGTAAKAHVRGSLVIVVDDFSVAMNAVALTTNLNAIRVVDSAGRLVRLPFGTVGTSLGIVRVTYTETPTFLEETGPRDIARIEMDAESLGNTALDPLNAAGDAPGFEGRNFSIVAPGSNLLALERAASVAFRGRVEKILVTIMHSGNRADTSILGDVEVRVGGMAVGVLSPTDQFDADLQAVARGRNRGPVDVPDAPTRQAATLYFDVHRQTNDTRFNTVTNGWITAADKARVTDKSLNAPPGRCPSTGGTPNNDRNEFQVTVLPPNISATDSLQKVRLKVRHGADAEANVLPPGQSGNYLLEIERPAFLGPGTPPPASIQATSGLLPLSPIVKDDFVEWDVSSLSYTNAEIFNMQFTMMLLSFLGSTAPVYAVYEAWLEIEYLAADPAQDTGSIQNDIEVPLLIASTWDDLQTLEVEVEGDGVDTDIQVFHVLFNVLFTPQRHQPPERIFLDVDCPTLQGTPADIISELWQNALLGNNAPSTIDLAAFAAASVDQAAAGYVAAAIASVLRGPKLMEAIVALAAETRLRVFLDLGQLRAAFVADLSALPAPSATLTRAELAATPVVQGIDIEAGPMVNRVAAKFDRTEREDFRGTLRDEDLGSIAAFGEFFLDLGFGFVKSLAAAQATVDSLLERRAAPWDELSLSQPLDFGRVRGLLDLLALTFGWYSASRFEVELVVTESEHRVTVRGRTLPP